MTVRMHTSIIASVSRMAVQQQEEAVAPLPMTTSLYTSCKLLDAVSPSSTRFW